MQVISFFREAAFSPETTQVMGQAFDHACKALRDYGQPDSVKEVIAKQIIELAKTGERDPVRLSECALSALGVEGTAKHAEG